MKLKEKCAKCGKILDLVEEQILIPDKLYLSRFACGHNLLGARTVIPDEIKDFTSLTGDKQAYDFQVEGVNFALSTDMGQGITTVLADAMGLGKTIQSILITRIAAMRRILVIVKSATTYQWIREIHEWGDDSPLAVFPIIGTKSFIPPGFHYYVVSMDTIGRNGTYKKIVDAVKPDVIIADECQSFKEDDSARTKALIKMIKEGNVKHRIFLSGTPIKNRANEYFTILNLIAPSAFPNRRRFEREWLIPNAKGIYTRINPNRYEQFQSLIGKWVLRREKNQVLKNLPKFQRNFQDVYIEDQDIKNSYNRELDLMSNLMNASGKLNTISLLGALAKLRRITGIAKAEHAYEYITEFLENTDTDKIAIGIHHEAVRDLLYAKLLAAGWKPLKLSGEDSAIKKDQIVQSFGLPEHRVLIINTLAGGVGLNLQMCANTLVLERQWNFADEEQFECRFHRNGQTLPVTADYLIAHGTIDEWFAELVEEKKKIFGETVGWDFTNDESLLKDLVDKTLANRL